jgi:RecG-like helicase
MTTTATQSGERPMQRLKAALERALSSTGQLTDEELVRQAVDSGATPIGETQARQAVTLRGAIAAVTLSPRRTSRWLEADLNDGTGVLRLIWMGRRGIAGITPGRRLVVHGRIAMEAGRKVIYNPVYELVAEH